MINIPKDCTHVKIDIGLSYNAPHSSKWIQNEPNLFVIGVDPNPNAIKSVKELNLPRFQLLEFAIDSKTRSSEFFITKHDTGCSSLFKPTSFEIKEKTIVKCITLKELLDDFPWDRFEYIEFIKVDTQGSDLNVLKSAENYLKDKVVFVAAEGDGDLYGQY